MTSISDTATINPDMDYGQRCTCSMYHAAEKKKKKPEDELPFWLTYTGLVMRIDGLSQDFLFGVTNDAIATAAEVNQIQYLHYITAEDDRVCAICQTFARGGNNGYYRVGSPMPRIPGDTHRWCRCQWELVIADLSLPALPR